METSSAMSPESIVLGIVRWARREFASKFPPMSPAQIGLFTVSALAEKNPKAALSLLSAMPGLGPVSGALAAAAGPNFEPVVSALLQTLREQGGIRVFADGRPFIVSRDDVEAIVAEIRSIDAAREKASAAPAQPPGALAFAHAGDTTAPCPP